MFSIFSIFGAKIILFVTETNSGQKDELVKRFTYFFT